MTEPNPSANLSPPFNELRHIWIPFGVRCLFMIGALVEVVMALYVLATDPLVATACSRERQFVITATVYFVLAALMGPADYLVRLRPYKVAWLVYYSLVYIAVAVFGIVTYGRESTCSTAESAHGPGAHLNIITMTNFLTAFMLTSIPFAVLMSIRNYQRLHVIGVAVVMCNGFELV